MSTSAMLWVAMYRGHELKTAPLSVNHSLVRRMVWKKRLQSLSEAEFVARYKLSKATFQDLVEKLRPYVGVHTTDRFARSSSGSGVSTELCLSMTLRYLCGGHVLDIIDLHGVAKATFYHGLWITISAINVVLSLPGLPLKNEEGLRKLSEGFHLKSKGTMRGCVGAIDGIAIQIIKPSAWDTIQPQTFKNRKKFYSINCQAICDADLRFLWASMRSPGGTHDSLAWGCTDLCAYLTEHGLPDGFYLVGDDAYTGTPWMLTPYPLHNLTRTRSDFNFYQSR